MVTTVIPLVAPSGAHQWARAPGGPRVRLEAGFETGKDTCVRPVGRCCRTGRGTVEAEAYRSPAAPEAGPSVAVPSTRVATRPDGCSPARDPLWARLSAEAHHWTQRPPGPPIVTGCGPRVMQNLEPKSRHTAFWRRGRGRGGGARETAPGQIMGKHQRAPRKTCCAGASCGMLQAGGGGRDALEVKGPRRWLEEVAKAVGGGYCRLQMPLKLALGDLETVAGLRLGALDGGGGVPPPLPMHPWVGGTQIFQKLKPNPNLRLAVGTIWLYLVFTQNSVLHDDTL